MLVSVCVLTFVSIPVRTVGLKRPRFVVFSESARWLGKEHAHSSTVAPVRLIQSSMEKLIVEAKITPGSTSSSAVSLLHGHVF